MAIGLKIKKKTDGQIIKLSQSSNKPKMTANVTHTCYSSMTYQHRYIKECSVTILKVLQIKRHNFVNESHLLIWGKLQLGIIR